MNVPSVLYRFFKSKEHLEDFLNGEIRFGRLEFYREIEDEARKDIEEGRPRGKYSTDKLQYLTINNRTGKVIGGGYKTGDIEISGSSPNSFHILAASDENADLKLLSSKFGKYIIRIDDPQKFLNLLEEKSDLPGKVGRIRLAPVKYDRGVYIEMEEGSAHLPEPYYYAQKSEFFANEKEWRYVITGSAIEEIVEDFVVINVGSIRGLVSIVDSEL